MLAGTLNVPVRLGRRRGRGDETPRLRRQTGFDWITLDVGDCPGQFKLIQIPAPFAFTPYGCLILAAPRGRTRRDSFFMEAAGRLGLEMTNGYAQCSGWTTQHKVNMIRHDRAGVNLIVGFMASLRKSAAYRPRLDPGQGHWRKLQRRLHRHAQYVIVPHRGHRTGVFSAGGRSTDVVQSF